jgi:deazaflavin-dependent oxidoreductase (nitroreductase family)
MTIEDFKKTLEGKDEIEITVTGRASGREISLPVWFVRAGDRLHLLPIHGSDTDWYRNVVQTPAIRVQADGAELNTEAAPITDDARVREVVGEFGAKYGAERVEAYYPKRNVAIEVPLA